MRKHHFISILLVSAGLLIALVGSYIMSRESNETLKVLYVYRVLREDPLLLNPHKIVSIFDYYLLENLSAGLVRDDFRSETGYTGVIAKSWEQIDSKTWTFRLRENLKWSDGSPMTGDQLVRHFVDLMKSGAKHLRQLSKNLESCEYLSGDHALKFHFKTNTNQSVLHEFSLADAAVLHPSNLTTDWKVTSGPYSVKSYRPAERHLELKLNPHCLLATNDSPQEVIVGGKNEDESYADAFQRLQADLFLVPAPIFHSRYRAIEPFADEIVSGHRSSVYFMYFNGDHELASNLDARLELSELFHQTFEGRELMNGTVIFDDQLIPEGYAGRLANYERKRQPIKVLKGKNLLLTFPDPLKEFSDELENLKQKAASHGVELSFRFQSFADSQKSDGDFAKLMNFIGNQKDELGTWTYLFFGDDAFLRSFSKDIQTEYDRAMTAESSQDRQNALQALHRLVLDRGIAIPFLSEGRRVLASDRVDLSRWNHFDMRQRFYDVRWK